ncbi:hypothetical protein BU25DRAFT_167606 [Macroventuria anomochaeta]|uniref:Uncharacterized protein n=1 Tax=Macroventuria anomochaeta TaxID=301207 RepID=A0ACB6RPE9_9PLEO|nr:uncharacterized protein BU25DRAFT_167606 [Macroventuria anomochaeta]KAF2623825.1 hypothetical protein BU25DRAFT_167606 [Macroventuria anomochaeta]
MEEPTTVLRHYQDNCSSLNLSLARQVEGMEQAEPNKSYLDLRSASRARYHHLRKRQSLTLRWKHCHLDCPAYEHRHLSSRHRRMKKWKEECNEEAYWDERIVRLEHKESLEFMDPVQAYYNHGHNTTAIESLRPTKYVEEEEAGGHDWVDVDDSPDDALEVEVITSPSWALSLHPPPQSNSSPFPVAGRCVWGESTFTWHRNTSGYWELGYANQYMVDEMVDPYGCRQTPLPLSCHCCSPNFGIHVCSCTEFDEHEPSPEDQQRCHLMEWLTSPLSSGISYPHCPPREVGGFWMSRSVLSQCITNPSLCNGTHGKSVRSLDSSVDL